MIVGTWNKTLDVIWPAARVNNLWHFRHSGPMTKNKSVQLLLLLLLLLLVDLSLGPAHIPPSPSKSTRISCRIGKGSESVILLTAGLNTPDMTILLSRQLRIYIVEGIPILDSTKPVIIRVSTKEKDWV